MTVLTASVWTGWTAKVRAVSESDDSVDFDSVLTIWQSLDTRKVLKTWRRTLPAWKATLLPSPNQKISLWIKNYEIWSMSVVLSLCGVDYGCSLCVVWANVIWSTITRFTPSCLLTYISRPGPTESDWLINVMLRTNRGSGRQRKRWKIRVGSNRKVFSFLSFFACYQRRMRNIIGKAKTNKQNNNNWSADSVLLIIMPTKRQPCMHAWRSKAMPLVAAALCWLLASTDYLYRTCTQSIYPDPGRQNWTEAAALA